MIATPPRWTARGKPVPAHDGAERQDKGYALSISPKIAGDQDVRLADNPNELILEFDENRILPELYGEHDRHLAIIEDRLGVACVPRGNRLLITGPHEARVTAADILRDLYRSALGGMNLSAADINGAIRMADDTSTSYASASQNLQIKLRRRQITPRSPTQARYIQALKSEDLVFGLGPAGTGKTYLAVAFGVSKLAEGKVDRLILSRPAVEAGERLGFLPGDMKEKIDPYLRPLYDALHDMYSGDQIERKLSSGEIEVAPLAFMRGRTLTNSFIILDEAQNCTPMQLKMFLTRLGENSQMVVTGDPSQTDLPPGTYSGLSDAMQILDGIEGLEFVRFSHSDVVRHPLVSRIVQAYDSQPQPGKGKPAGNRQRRPRSAPAHSSDDAD